MRGYPLDAVGAGQVAALHDAFDPILYNEAAVAEGPSSGSGGQAPTAARRNLSTRSRPAGWKRTPGEL